MQNFLNSPQGPLGAAGQTSTSTMPQNLFNNAGSFGSRFGAGIDSFKNSMGSFRDSMQQGNPLDAVKGLFGSGGALGNLFGGDGGFLNGLFGQKGLGGVPQSLSQIPQNVAQIPQNVGGMLSQFNRPQGSAGASGGGFLSRFMNNGQS
jgi:hypothetical protein